MGGLPALLSLLLLRLAASQEQVASCGCAADPLKGFVRRSGSSILDAENRTIRFSSINVPNLHRVELSSEVARQSAVASFTVSSTTSVTMPTEWEVRDALCSVRQMGARVARIYVLSHGDSDAFHVGTGGLLNEAWFQALDMVFAVAKELGVRLIVPFINTFYIEAWGHSGFYASWAGERRQDSAFFTSTAQRSLFKTVLGSVLERVNTRTGKKYLEEEAVFAWELGNELHDVAFGPRPVIGVTPPPPTEWTRDITRFIKSLDPNHLVMDGGQFATPALEVSELDIVGSTYYGRQLGDIAAEVEALEVWNWMSHPDLRKAFMIKEFGLMEQSTTIPLQNMDWVKGVLQVPREHLDVVGAMYWSLRQHAEEGGFFHHAEEGGNIRSLHWPGFSTGPPNYEIEIFSEIRALTMDLGGNASWPQEGQKPCAPKIVEPSASTCISFQGSTGAAQYELWARPADQGEDAWQVVRENVTDDETALRALAGADPASLVLEFGGSGVQQFSFCLRACSAREGLRGNHSNITSFPCLWATNLERCSKQVPLSCSACSPLFNTTVDLGQPAACNLTGNFTDYDALWLEYYLELFDYGGLRLESGILVAVVAGLALVLLLAFCCRAGPVQPGQALASLQAGTKRSSGLDLLRLLAAVHLAFGVGVRYGWFGSGSLAQVVTNLASWGPAQYSFIFLYAGFISAVRFAHLAERLDVWPIFWRNLARTYPAFLVFAAFSLCHSAVYFARPVTGRFFFMLPLCGHAWRGDLQFGNADSELSWVFGPLLLFSAMVLPICARLWTFSQSALRSTLLVAWAASLWQTGHYLNVRIFVLDEAVTWIVLRAYTPSFMAGAALGALFSKHYSSCGEPQAWRGATASWRLLWLVERLGVTVGLILMIGFFLAVRMQDLGSFLEAWATHGALLPLQAGLLWSAAAGTDLLLRVPLERALEKLPASGLWFYCLAAAQSANVFTAPVVNGQHFLVELLSFFGALLALAALGEFLVRGPARAWAAKNVLKPSALGLSFARAPATLSKREQTFLYFAALVAILGTFAFYALEEETIWLNVGTMPEGAATASMNYISLLLYVPAMALLMGLAGQVIYPPTLEPDAKPVKLQLQHERLSGRKPFRIAFRIVTRGNSPMLVDESVKKACKVLEASLPREWWLLEVVTDNALDLARLNLPVVELLVPSDYRPPGGCLFKARALNYAISASALGEEDWVVHLDEETSFDGDTVAHILEHCAAQNARVAADKQAYGHIGQGVILYNVSCQENLLCCLADTVRVADDFGKFAVQYKLTEQPLIGMHGSFVVCANAVEKAVGFDWGLAGSITEDAFFAMKCASEGVHVKWCGGHMYEQSPFGVRDFAKQRCRWFAGLWLCVRSRELPLLHRTILGSHVVSWAFCPLLNLLAWTNWLVNLARPGPMRVSLALLYAIPLFGYLLGFFWTFTPSKLRHGVPEFFMLLVLQVLGVPVYAAMEAFGVAKALWERPFKKFELVQKEKPKAAVAEDDPESAAAEESGVLPEEAANQPKEKEQPPQRQTSSSEEPNAPAEQHHALLAAASSPGLPQVARPRAPKKLGEDLGDPSPFSPFSPQDSVPVSFGMPPALDGERHWRSVLAGVPCSLAVPRDGPVGAPAREASLDLPLEAGAELIAAHAACGTSAVELPDLLLASMGFVISSFSHEDLFIVGCAAPRDMEAGLPVRLELDYERSLLELAASLGAQRAQSRAVAAADGPAAVPEILRHGGEEWTEWLRSRGGPWQFAVQQAPPGKEAPRSSSAADLLLVMPSSVEIGTAPLLKWCYNGAVFCEATVRRWSQCLRWVLRAAADKPQGSLKEISLLDEPQDSVLALAGGEEVFSEEPLHLSFLAQAQRAPEALALVEGSERWTYEKLASVAKSLAAQITDVLEPTDLPQGDWLVGLIFERSIDLVAVVYGVLMAGAGYLPMEPDFPNSRVEEILEDAGSVCPMVLVGARELAQKLPWSYMGRVACASRNGLSSPDGDAFPCMAVPESAHYTPRRGSGLAYCMYTSGTTGKPKGVMCGHRELAMRTGWLQSAFNLKSASCVPFKTPYIFGVSEWELFWPLTVGAHVAVVPPETVRSLEAFSELLAACKCSHACFVPSHLAALLRYWGSSGAGSVPRYLLTVIACGEVLTAETARAFGQVLGGASLHNLYGPTEGSMTWKALQKEAEGAPSSEALLGKPISNTAVLLLDRWQKLVPVGVPGEVHFGRCLARGYLNRPELTREKFVPNPFATSLPGFREVPTLYRTGDLAMWTPSGELRFVGRADRQVKVRGFRIELGAVEAALRKAAPSATAVAAIALPPAAERPGGELVAFVEAGDADAESLRPKLAELLPLYMVPSRLLGRAAFPKLPSGKPDLRALAREAASGSSEPQADGVGQSQQPSQPQKQLLDSLGMARKLAAGDGSAAAEARISDNMRTVLMYGVIFDHWAGCTDEGRCQAVVEGMLWRQTDSVKPRIMWVEPVLRAIGNYKDMTGFMMVSAYNDSAYADAAYFSKTDLVILIAYMQMIWVMDPIIWMICRADTSGGYCDATTNYFTGAHRWYLQTMLLIKVFLVLFRMLRIPPLAQCVLVTLAGFVMPSEIMCLDEEKCPSLNDPVLWTQNFRSLDFLWTLIYKGLAEDIYDMFTSFIMRYYVLFAAQYFWTFFYGRAAVAAFQRWFQRHWGGKEGAKSQFRLLQISAGVGLLAMELASTSVLGPVIYNYMQEDVTGTHEPQLLPLALMLVGLAVEVALLALATSCIKRRCKLLGSTTLGCYMFHMYLTYPIMLLRPYFDGLGSSLGPLGFVLQLLLMLCLPLLMQCTLGVAFHRLLLWEMKMVFRFAQRLGALVRCPRRR